MNILATVPCLSVFLGDRHYLHSTTIVKALVDACANAFDCGKVQQMSAQFHALTDRQCVFDRLQMEPGESLTGAGYVATFKTQTGQGSQVFGLRPLIEGIIETRPFDEDGLANAAVLNVDDQRIGLVGVNGELLPAVVALNKRLHAALFSPAGYSKWLLTRLDLNNACFELSRVDDICLQIVSVLASVSTKATITVNSSVGGVIIGSVHFSRKKEAT